MKAKIDVREGEEAADAVASELAGKLAGRGGGSCECPVTGETLGWGAHFPQTQHRP